MADSDPDCPPVVSVQRGNAPDLVAGHLTWGVLLGDSTLIVVPPLDWTTGQDPLFAVLASAREEGPGYVERIGLRRIELLGSSDDLAACVACVTLSSSPRHRGADAARTQQRLERAMARSPDLWTALEQLRIVPARLRELDPEAVLRPVIGWEVQARRELVDPFEVRTEDDIIFRFCRIFGGCQCSGEWW